MHLHVHGGITAMTEHGIRFSSSGHRIALWCACQRRDRQRAPRLARPVAVRSSWTVSEALESLRDWHLDREQGR